MPPSTVDERLRGDYEVNTTGEPDALKGARPVRKGTERKGLATAPRSQSTLHHMIVVRNFILRVRNFIVSVRNFILGVHDFILPEHLFIWERLYSNYTTGDHHR